MSNVVTKPVVESDKHHALYPRFTGFSGIYCFIEDRPLKAIIDSSTHTVPEGLYKLVNLSLSFVNNGHNLCNLS